MFFFLSQQGASCLSFKSHGVVRFSPRDLVNIVGIPESVRQIHRSFFLVQTQMMVMGFLLQQVYILILSELVFFWVIFFLIFPVSNGLNKSINILETEVMQCNSTSIVGIGNWKQWHFRLASFQYQSSQPRFVWVFFLRELVACLP